MHNVSKLGKDLIKKWETNKLSSYRAPEGKWTIGYGSTYIPKSFIVNLNGEDIAFPEDTPITSSMTLGSNDDSELLLDHLLKERYGKCVNNSVKVKINQSQFDAMVSLCFNIGENNFRKSTLLSKLNNKDYAGAAAQFMRWNKYWEPHLKKQILSQGLINRRVQETEVFLTGYNDTIFKERFSWFSSIFKG